jgi:DNA-binding XRE family transcriptional regulator
MLSKEDKLYRIVATRLRERRKELKMTQTELAEEVSLLRTSIANIEATRQRPSLHLLYSLCSALDTDVRSVLPSESELSSFHSVELNTQGGIVKEVPELTANILRYILAQGDKDEVAP